MEMFPALFSLVLALIIAVIIFIISAGIYFAKDKRKTTSTNLFTGQLSNTDLSLKEATKYLKLTNSMVKK